MASAIHVQIYYYLRVVLQDVQATLDMTVAAQETAQPDPNLVETMHRQLVEILSNRVRPLLDDRSLADDVGITDIKQRIGAVIYASTRDKNAMVKPGKRQEWAGIQLWLKQWISALDQCVKIFGYIHPDLIAAVDHALSLIRAATVHPTPNAPIATEDLPRFIVTLVPVGNPAADSPIHRANMAVLGAVQAAHVQTAGAIATFLRQDFAATTDLMNQLQGNPNQVMIQNVCMDCGRVVRASEYSTESLGQFVCAKTDSKLHTSSFIRKCRGLAQERKNSPSSYLNNEREGVHFETPASFTSWVNNGNFRLAKRIYGPRATAMEMCHLSRNGFLGEFNELWTFLPYESRLYVLNCSLRGHHVDAFPDLIGRETIQLDVSSVITFLGLRVTRNDKALERMIESRDDTKTKKKQASPRKVSRLTDNEIGPPIVFSQPSSSSASKAIAADNDDEDDDDEEDDEEDDANEEEEEDEDMLVYTKHDVEVPQRDLAQLVASNTQKRQLLKKRAIFYDEDDRAMELAMDQEIKVDDLDRPSGDTRYNDEADEDSDYEPRIFGNQAELSDSEESNDDEDIIELQAEEERVRKRTVADIRAEMGVQAEIEQVAVAGSADSDVRTAWTFTYRDMKNALYLLTSTTFDESRSRLDHLGKSPSPADLKTLAQLILYCVLPPSDQVAKVKTKGNGEVDVLIHDNVAPTQHSRLFERRLETTAAQIGPIKQQESKNIVDKMLLRLATIVIAEAAGTDKKEPREDLKPVAVYLAHIARKRTPWAQIRNGDLSEFPDEIVPDTARENAIVKTMQPYFSYATGLFPVRQVTGQEKTYDAFVDAVWSTEYKLVDDIADGILPPIEAEDAWDRLAETSPRRLESLMRVLSRLFGDASSVYFTKRDWAGLIITADSLIRRSTSQVFKSEEAEEYEFRAKKKNKEYLKDPRFFTKDYAEILMRKVDAKARSFNVKDYAKMASTMLGWISIIVPRDLRLLQMVAWQAPYDSWVFDNVRKYRVLHGLRPPNVDEDKQDDTEREMANALTMMEKDILTEIRSVRRRDRDEKEAARDKFFGNRNISLAELRTYVDLWGQVHNPRDNARLTFEERANARNRLSRLEREAFPENKRIEDLTQKLRVAKETLASSVHDTKVYTAEVVYSAINDENSTSTVVAFLTRLKEQRLDPKILDAADKVIGLRKEIDAEKRAKDRTFYLGQWIYTKRRILDVDIFSEKGDPEGKDPEAKLHADLKLSEREVFPQILEIEALQIAQQEVIASLDETTRGYINSRSEHELRGLVKKAEADASVSFSVPGIAEVLRLRSEMRKLEREVAKDQQILVEFVIRRNAAQDNEDPELRVSQRTKLFQRLLFALGYIWPTLGQSHAGNVPKDLITKINKEKSETQKYSALHQYMVIVDHVVAEAIWTGTPTRQIMDVKKPLDYKVSALVHSRDFLQQHAKNNPILVRSLFTMYRELGYPWKEDDFRFVLQWNYKDTDTTFECFNKLIQTCRRPENTRWRRMLLDILNDEKEPLDLGQVYQDKDPRRIHSRLRESVLNRIPLTEREILFLLEHRWHQLGPDELDNFPTLTASQIQFIDQRVVNNDLIQRLGPINAMGIHALYVFSKLTPGGLKNVFNPQVRADEAYRFIEKQGTNLRVMRKNPEFCEFEGMAGVMHKIAKVRAYGPFFKGATNFVRQSFFVGNVEVSSDLYDQLN